MPDDEVKSEILKYLDSIALEVQNLTDDLVEISRINSTSDYALSPRAVLALRTASENASRARNSIRKITLLGSCS